MQVSYRLFELTNTLKMAFVPSRDDKRLLRNLITSLAISVTLYALALIVLNVPKILVCFPLANFSIENICEIR